MPKGNSHVVAKMVVVMMILVDVGAMLVDEMITMMVRRYEIGGAAQSNIGGSYNGVGDDNGVAGDHGGGCKSDGGGGKSKKDSASL